MEVWLCVSIFTESLSIIFNGYGGGVIVTFDRDLSPRRVRVFDDIR
jgi:hypothetical protein